MRNQTACLIVLASLLLAAQAQARPLENDDGPHSYHFNLMTLGQLKRKVSSKSESTPLPAQPLTPAEAIALPSVINKTVSFFDELARLA